MKLKILGCYAATPRSMTNPSAQVLELRNRLFLIDCGEGTQMQLRKQKVRFSKIDHIFISHLHGDHFFGLPGLLSTFKLLGREKELHIYGPKGIKEAVTLMLKVGDSWTNYDLVFHELESKTSELIFEDDAIAVYTIPLEHRIYTNGYLFKEKLGERKLNIEEVRKYDIPVCDFQNLKNGKDAVLEDGRIIPNTLLTDNPPHPWSYAYCSDTVYKEDIVPLLQNVKVLYHESTFLESERRLTGKTKHSTAIDAATIAQKAQVSQLILGHYSTRYTNLDHFKAEAETVFDHVHLAEDGKEFQF
ncbi:ribonuclease Z [Sediminicola luteus]|uniref:Ribonuclease Z n=1 Tax=Sediminicola luteus TaxID=319238 RepID=A0A2A4GB84_9FLAO|nr:ribonuclease Z [Sediminicola luteus]PCE65012.1 ribonuclease Z [Sediminicola luteus]